MSEGPDIRVSDAEREAVAGVLRDAGVSGRLDADELEERLRTAFAARTRANLYALTADLPAAQAPVTVLPRAPALRGEHLRRRLAGFLIPNLICNAVWLATGAGSWWPVWVLLGTGIGFGVWIINAGLGVEDRRDRPRERRARHRHGPPPPPRPPSLRPHGS